MAYNQVMDRKSDREKTFAHCVNDAKRSRSCGSLLAFNNAREAFVKKGFGT